MKNRSSQWCFAGAGLFAIISGGLYLGYRTKARELDDFQRAQTFNKLTDLHQVEDGSLVVIHAKATTKVPRSYCVDTARSLSVVHSLKVLEVCQQRLCTTK